MSCIASQPAGAAHVAREEEDPGQGGEQGGACMLLCGMACLEGCTLVLALDFRLPFVLLSKHREALQGNGVDVCERDSCARCMPFLSLLAAHEYSVPCYMVFAFAHRSKRRRRRLRRRSRRRPRLRAKRTARLRGARRSKHGTGG